MSHNSSGETITNCQVRFAHVCCPCRMIHSKRPQFVADSVCELHQFKRYCCVSHDGDQLAATDLTQLGETFVNRLFGADRCGFTQHRRLQARVHAVYSASVWATDVDGEYHCHARCRRQGLVSSQAEPAQDGESGVPQGTATAARRETRSWSQHRRRPMWPCERGSCRCQRHPACSRFGPE